MSRFYSLLLFFMFFLGINSAYATESVLPYNYQDTFSLPIKLNITEEISTKQCLKSGQKLEFLVAEDVVYNDKPILKKGDLVTAYLSLVVLSGMNGFPAEITVDNFDVPNIKDSQLLCAYTKYGANRSLMVYPIKWALTPIPFVGSLTNFIKGGHAKIKPSDVVTIEYFPNWK